MDLLPAVVVAIKMIIVFVMELGIVLPKVALLVLALSDVIQIQVLSHVPQEKQL